MKKGFLFAAAAAIRMKEKMLLFLIVLLLGGCDAEKKEKIIVEPDGRQDDTIILSEKEHTFKDDGGDFTITTEGTRWLIGGCYVDSKSYGFGCTVECGEVSNYEGFNIYCDSFGNPGIACEISKIEYSWFTITKETRQKIVFNVLPNETGKPRKIRLLMSDRNYFTSIEIDQLAE